MPSAFGPYTVSPELLAREDMRAALAAHDFAAAFLLMRRYDGASQDRIASQIESMTQSRISKIMRGEAHITAFELVERIADGLRIPGALLRLAPRTWEGLSGHAAPVAAGRRLTTPPARQPDTLPAVHMPAHPSGTGEPTAPEPQPGAEGPDRRTVLAAGVAAAHPATATGQESAAFLERHSTSHVDPLLIEQFADDARRLAIDYIGAPPETVLATARDTRRRVFAALDHTHRPDQLRELYLTGGILSGILAYAAMDLDKAGPAMANARTALLCAEMAGHTDLAVWTRGTQSLIARFTARYRDAHKYILAGLELKPTGAGLARLTCGQAQCLAHFGDTAGARAALAAAHDAAGSDTEPDDFAAGLFAFPRARVHYYAGSALIWLPDPADARTADAESTTALDLFGRLPADERFITDEILAHVYRATARVLTGDLDAAADALRPVLDIPQQQRVSWHRHRMARITTLLDEPRYHHSPTADTLRQEIAAF